MAIRKGTSSSDDLNGTSSRDTISGFAGNDILRGLGGNDKLNGGGGNDKLSGGGGNDKLIGGAGKDVLNGNAGKDFLTGGSGSDTFVFKHARETRPDSAADVITDFTRKDFVNIKNIDANKSVAGNQDFKFIGSAEFSQEAGELRYSFTTSGGKARTVISGDQNGDGVPDFQIVLLKHIAISSANIIGDF